MRNPLALLTLLISLLLTTSIHAQADKPATAFLIDQSFLKDVNDDGVTTAQAFNLRVAGLRNMTHYNFVVGPLSSTNCNDAANYSPDIPRKQHLFADLSSFADQMLILCMTGKRIRNGVVSRVQLPEEATTYVWFHNAGNTIGSNAVAVLSDTDFLRDIHDGKSEEVDLNLEVTGLNGASVYAFKVATATDCDDLNGYSSFSSINDPLVTNIAGLADGQVTLCLIGDATAAQPQSFSYTWFKDTGAIPAPGVFQIQSPSGLTNNQLPTLTWTASTDAASYNLFVAADATCTAMVTSMYSTTATSYTLSSPLPSGTYYSCVTALNNTDSQAASNNGLEFIVDVTAPDAFSITGPSGIVTTATIRIEWQAANGASTYLAYISANSDCATVDAGSYTADTFLDLNIASDGSYYACVTAEDSIGNKTVADNNGVAFTVDTMAPAAFGIIGPVGTVSIATPLIEWESSLGASTYNLTIATDAQCSQDVENAQTSSTSWQAASLSDGDYYICVSASDNANWTTQATNNGSSFTVATAPPVSHVVFATSFLTNVTTLRNVPPPYPAFGGIEAASWICSLAAAASGLLPNWDFVTPVYRAVLSDSTADAADQVNFRGSIFNTNGDFLANGGADFYNGTLQSPIRYDEYGFPIATAPNVWSGTGQDGTATSETCGNWDNPSAGTTTAGTILDVDWHNGPSIACNNYARLLCASPGE